MLFMFSSLLFQRSVVDLFFFVLDFFGDLDFDFFLPAFDFGFSPVFDGGTRLDCDPDLDAIRAER